MLDAAIGSDSGRRRRVFSNRVGATEGRSSAFRGHGRQNSTSLATMAIKGNVMTHTKGSWRSRSTILKAAAFATAAGLLATPVFAVHSWSTYHWKRTSTQISPPIGDRKSTRLNSSHLVISYAVFCLKKK